MTEQTLSHTQSNTASAMTAKDSNQQDYACTVRPLADVVEAADRVALFVELPGVLPEDLEVAVENGIVDITGIAHRRLPEGFQALGRGERSRRYFRQFKLADTLDATQMQAEFKNGLLKLVVPKKPENRRQTIAITISV